MQATAFWNNKGGTGKTSLAFQALCAYAQKYPKKRILAVDACPQAEFFLSYSLVVWKVAEAKIWHLSKVKLQGSP